MVIWDQMSINVGHQFIWRQIYVEQQEDKKTSNFKSHWPKMDFS